MTGRELGKNSRKAPLLFPLKSRWIPPYSFLLLLLLLLLSLCVKETVQEITIIILTRVSLVDGRNKKQKQEGSWNSGYFSLLFFIFLLLKAGGWIPSQGAPLLHLVSLVNSPRTREIDTSSLIFPMRRRLPPLMAINFEGIRRWRPLINKVRPETMDSVNKMKLS